MIGFGFILVILMYIAQLHECYAHTVILLDFACFDLLGFEYYNLWNNSQVFQLSHRKMQLLAYLVLSHWIVLCYWIFRDDVDNDDEMIESRYQNTTTVQ